MYEHFKKYVTIKQHNDKYTATFKIDTTFPVFTNADGTPVTKKVMEDELTLYLHTALQELTDYYELDYQLEQLKKDSNV